MVKYNSFPRRCHPFLIWLLKFKNLQCVLTKFSEFSMSSFCQTRRNLQHVRSTRLFFYLMQICLFYPILRLCQLPSTELIFFFKKKKKKKRVPSSPASAKFETQIRVGLPFLWFSAVIFIVTLQIWTSKFVNKNFWFPCDITTSEMNFRSVIYFFF
jgi:hypothetical protein